MTNLILKNTNLLGITEGIIAHQVNTLGVMGAGVAKQISTKFPFNYQAYRESYYQQELVLGKVILAQVDYDLYVANIVAQSAIGTHKRQTDYTALATGLQETYKHSKELGLIPYLPYMIGCGLGGGDWSVVSALIDKHCPNAIICQL